MADEEQPKPSEPVTVSKDGTISIKTGTIITIISAILGTGGGAGLITALQGWAQQPNPEIIKRLEAIEERLASQEEAQRQSALLGRIIYKTIIRSHPEAAIPLEDLGFNPQ